MSFSIDSLLKRDGKCGNEKVRSETFTGYHNYHHDENHRRMRNHHFHYALDDMGGVISYRGAMTKEWHNKKSKRDNFMKSGMVLFFARQDVVIAFFGWSNSFAPRGRVGKRGQNIVNLFKNYSLSICSISIQCHYSSQPTDSAEEFSILLGGEPRQRSPESNRDGESDVNIKPNRKRRILFTREQTHELQKVFQYQQYLTVPQRDFLSRKINLTPTQVNIHRLCCISHKIMRL